MKSVFFDEMPDVETAIRESRKAMLQYGEPDYYMTIYSPYGAFFKVRAIICETENERLLVEREIKENKKNSYFSFHSREEEVRVRLK